MRFFMLGVDSSPGNGVPAVVAVTPSMPTVPLGQAQQFQAVCTDDKGQTFAAPVVAWSVTGPGVIDSNGLFTPTAPGTATVVAKVGKVTGQTQVTATEGSRGSAPAPAEGETDWDELEPVRDDLLYPRQGEPSFHATVDEIDPQPDTRADLLEHYPTMRDLEGWPVNDRRAQRWAGLKTHEFVGHGGGGHGGGGHGGHHGGGGHFRGGGGPFFTYPVAVPILLEDDDLDDDDDDGLRFIGFHIGAAVNEPGYVEGLVKDFSGKLSRVPVTYSVAKVIAAKAIDMANQAEKIIKAQGSATLLGPSIYDVPRGHVQWHVDNSITKELAGRDPKTTSYERVDDLKKWAVECYHAFAAAQQDAALRAQVNAEFWADMTQVVMDVPKNVRNELGGGIEWVTGIPVWGWVALGVTGVGLVVYLLGRVIQAAGPTVAREAARRYLP